MPQCVLVVEDDRDTATLLSILLRSEGYALRLAETLADAHQSLAADPPPALVLLDVVLPDGDGLSLCPIIRQRWPHLPIVVVTAAPDPRTRASAATAGCPELLAKPFDPDVLVARVRELIGPP